MRFSTAIINLDFRRPGLDRAERGLSTLDCIRNSFPFLDEMSDLDERTAYPLKWFRFLLSGMTHLRKKFQGQ